MNIPADRKNFGSQAMVADERRSQRVKIRVPLKLRYEIDGKQNTVEANTIVVNNHGGMVACAHALAAGTNVEVEDARTGEKQRCLVTRTPTSSPPDGYLVPFEFLTPRTDFWHISFPPADWKPVGD